MTGPAAMDGITNADLYRKMEDLRVNVTVALEKLNRADGIHADQEARIRRLEQFRYSLMGAAMGAGAVVGTASGIISALITARH